MYIHEHICYTNSFIVVREHFSSPLLQLAEADAGQTFTLVECPSMRLSISPNTIQSFYNLFFRWNWAIDLPDNG